MNTSSMKEVFGELELIEDQHMGKIVSIGTRDLPSQHGVRGAFWHVRGIRRGCLT